MQKTVTFRKGRDRFPADGRQVLIQTMRISTFLFGFIAITTQLLSAATGFGQGSAETTISLDVRDMPMPRVFQAIEERADVAIMYENTDVLKNTRITYAVRHQPVGDILDALLVGKGLRWSIRDHVIRVERVPTSPVGSPVADGLDAGMANAGLILAFPIVKGKVIDSTGVALVGASIRVLNADGKRTALQAVTDKDGNFELRNVPEDAVLEISYIGYFIQTAKVAADVGHVVLRSNQSELAEVVINKGYYQTSERLNTGSVGRVSAAEIASQPVENPLAALQGRIPGLEVTTTTGMPGATFNVRIRGQNSLVQGSDPLFIVDGVPVATNGQSINLLTNAARGGTSLFSLINPADIESIEVLKDADATAIYGSRGANGVILITTKKGQPESLTYQLNTYQGWSNATRITPMLTTAEYIEMRGEAFENDGVVPTRQTAPDLLSWDPNRYTDFNEIIADNRAYTTDAQLALSGGSKQWQYSLGGGFHRQTTLTQGNQSSRRSSARFTLAHQSVDDRFGLDFAALYGHNTSNLTGEDLTSLITLPPHMQLHANDGSLYWGDGERTYTNMGLTNPYAQFFQSHLAKYANLNANIRLSYRVLTGLNLRLHGGYTHNSSQEVSKNPSRTLDPFSSQLPRAGFGNMATSSWILEPQLSYDRPAGGGEINVLLGGSFQSALQEGLRAMGIYYSNDALLNTIAGAGQVNTTNFDELYRYGAAFGRLHYNYEDKYLLNLTGRRDASSRFGPGKQFANFGALGAAWIFSEEATFNMPTWLSLGKLRASYGVTGNDQIGNYSFLDTWNPSNGVTYEGHVPLLPSKLYNPDFSWETNRKLEVGLELGVFNDRLHGSMSWFRNRSSTQLIQYRLPTQTGFPSILRNFDALVQNSGFEIVLSARDLLKSRVSWDVNLNVSLPSNELKSFPGIETSTYANQYVVGEPLSVKKVYRYLGVNPSTGIYDFVDANQDGLFNAQDRIVMLDTDPRFYGGLFNEFRYRSFALSFLFDFRKQLGRNYRATLSTPPGYQVRNYPKFVMNRWQKEGDVTEIGRFVSQSSSPAYRPATSFLIGSDAIYSDASFIRLRNVSFRYGIQDLKRIGVRRLEFTFQAQNLMTLTHYEAGDPETQNLLTMPPLKTMTFGCNLTF